MNNIMKFVEDTRLYRITGDYNNFYKEMDIFIEKVLRGMDFKSAGAIFMMNDTLEKAIIQQAALYDNKEIPKRIIGE